MFVSVKEAAELTGKSATTIYRLCNKRINTEYVRKEDNKFLINREFLMATYPPEEPVEQPDIVEEAPEMRFENVTEINSQTTPEEKPASLEKETPENNENTENIGKELGPGAMVEFNKEAKRSYFQQIISREVLISLAISLAAISIFIYLLSKLSN